MQRTLLAIAALGFSWPTLAADPPPAGGWLDVRLTGGSYEVDNDFDNEKIETEEASGFDVRGQFNPTERIFVRAEYLTSEADEIEINGTDFDADFEVDTVRGGAGFQGGSSFRYYGVVEYAEIELDLEGVRGKEDGLILSGGLKDAGAGAFLWNVELGLVKFDDSDGGAFEFTLGYRFNPHVALVGGAQGYGLEDDEDIELSVTHATLGVRVGF